MKGCFICAVVLTIMLGCSGKNDGPVENVEPEVPPLNKEEVMTKLSSNTYQIAEWHAVSGKDTTFLNEDQYYGAYMKIVYLLFADDRVYYYFGYSIPNTVFLGNAQTFDLNIFYFRPFGMTYHWDDEESTMMVPWKSKPDDIPSILPEGVTLRLDKKGYKRLKSFAEAKATRTTGTMRFHYQHEGKEYTMVLKQMWRFADGPSPKHVLCVVF